MTTTDRPILPPRHGRSELADALQDARNYTLALFDCLAGAGLDDAGPGAAACHLNPPLWELGHIAWFAEWFVLREAQSSASGRGAARRRC